MDYKQEYNNWLSNPAVDADTKAELEAIANDENEIKDRFYKNLEFGTAGLRGVIGAGTNRMNIYTVRRATQGIAAYICKHGDEMKQRGVAIAYDSRFFSPEFALEAALTLCANGIKAYLFESLRPTPELSFAVRHLHTIAGINITASHNPSNYNGYKAYWEDGAQIPPHVSDVVLAQIEATGMFDALTMSKEDALAQGLLTMIGQEVDNAYLDAVYTQSVNSEVVHKVADRFKLVYTPLHGTGNLPVRAILERSGFKHVLVVKEQELPDGAFPTVKSPNPENRECFDIAIEMAKANDVDLIIGTDPDADRTGIVIRDRSGEYRTMSGNQVGAMLTNFLITAKREQGTLAEDATVISTIVSTKMTEAICKKHGVNYMETLTGFKFIGEKILEFETNHDHTFLFGFEESYGYLAGTHARDKDAVVASLLIAQMAAYYFDKGKTLYDVMQEMYATYGGFAEKTVAITMPGIDGLEKIASIMRQLRQDRPETIGKFKVQAVRDYDAGVTYNNDGSTTALTLPKSNVLYFQMDGGVSFVARPSGTEPKIKLYYLAQGKDEAAAQAALAEAEAAVNKAFFQD